MDMENEDAEAHPFNILSANKGLIVKGFPHKNMLKALKIRKESS